MAVAPNMVVLLELDDDDGVISLTIGMLPAMNHAAVFAQGARSERSEAGEQRRHHDGRITFVNWPRLAPAWRPPPRVPCSRLPAPAAVRTTKRRADEYQCRRTPSGVKLTFERQPAADEAVLGIQRRGARCRPPRWAARTGIHQRVDHAVAGKEVAHQHPGHARPATAFSSAAASASAECEPVRNQHARAGHRVR